MNQGYCNFCCWSLVGIVAVLLVTGVVGCTVTQQHKDDRSMTQMLRRAP